MGNKYKKEDLTIVLKKEGGAVWYDWKWWKKEKVLDQLFRIVWLLISNRTVKEIFTKRANSLYRETSFALRTTVIGEEVFISQEDLLEMNPFSFLEFIRCKRKKLT